MRNKRPPQVWRFSQLLKKSLKNISLIISPSNYIKSFLVKNSITQQIVVLPNFIPDPPNRCKSIHEGEYFFYAGMLEETKGILNLLEAFIGTDKKLIIAGKGSLEKHVRKVANKYGNIKYVGFFNHQEIYSYFKNAQAYILSSLCPENSPLTILEAFAVGTPAIGSNIGGIPEIIGKVDKNLFFNPYDVHEIRETVMNFRKETYSTDHIKTIFNDNYSSDVYIDRYIHLINGSVHATKNSG